MTVNRDLGHFSVITSKWEHSDRFHIKDGINTKKFYSHSGLNTKFQYSTYYFFQKFYIYNVLMYMNIPTHPHTHTRSTANKLVHSHTYTSYVPVADNLHTHTSYHINSSTITVLYTHTRYCMIRHKDTNIWVQLNQLHYLHIIPGIWEITIQWTV